MAKMPTNVPRSVNDRRGDSLAENVVSGYSNDGTFCVWCGVQVSQRMRFKMGNRYRLTLEPRKKLFRLFPNKIKSVAF